MHLLPTLSLAALALAKCSAAAYASTKTFDFSTATGLPSGLSIDVGKVKSKPLAHKFLAKNVYVADGFLNLLVPGGQAGKKVITSAEVATTFKMKYGSFKTWAILTETPGVCNGFFTYLDDSQETDIEFISDPNSNSNLNSPNGTRAMQYTNQALDGNPDDETSVYGYLPPDATSAVHCYQMDWTADSTRFYIDGVLQTELTSNVPTKATYYLWNNWNDGNKGWTNTPPKTDAVLRIQKMVLAYNPA